MEDYVAGLREQLEAIPSLNNLNITTLWDDTEDKITFRHAQKTDDGMAVLAKGVVSRIDFDLYIPFRIQDGLARLRARSDTGTENFRSLRLAGRGEKIHEMVCRYGGRVPIREVWRARAMTAAVRRVLGLSETLGTCASSASNETRRS